MSTRRLLQANNARRLVVPYQLAVPGALGALGAATFSRADATTCATQIAADGSVPTVLANVLRDGHYVGVQRVILLETGGKNLVKDCDDLTTGNWGVGGTCAVTGGQADPNGGTTAQLLNSTVNGSSRFQSNLGYTGDGTKSVLVALKKGSANQNDLLMYDVTAPAARYQATVTWNAGVPTLSTKAGAGSFITPYAIGAGFYVCAIMGNGIVAANNNRLYIYPGTDSGQGSVTVWHFKAEDSAFPTSLIGTAGSVITRATDALSLAGVNLTGTLFLHYYDLATRAWVDAASAYVANTAIVPPVDRAYSHIAVLAGTWTAAQCKAILRGFFP